MKAYIYARVSSSGYQETRQSTERQVQSLSELARAMGYEVVEVFEEHVSGAKKNSEREGLTQCFSSAKEKKIDMIFFSEMSRCGRQIWEVLESIKFCIDNQINLHFQKEGLTLFKDGKVDSIMAIYVSCLGFCAEKERENIYYRLQQGLAVAKAKGVKVGRKEGSVKTREQKQREYSELIRALKRGLSIRDAAKVCGVSISTAQRIKKEFVL